MLVKFKKSHPKFAYFVGDVADVSQEKIVKHNLIEDGFAIPHVEFDDEKVEKDKKAKSDAT